MGAVVVVFFRPSPEGAGLVIDGGVADPADDGAGRPVGTDADATREVAVRDRRFWAVTIPVVAMASTGTALTFHILDLGEELGIADDRIVRIFLPIAIVSVPVTLVSGWLVDTIPPIAVAGFMSACQLVMYLTVPHLGGGVWSIVAIVSWGATQGCYAPLTSAALPRLFGRRHLGAIAGVQMSAMVIGSAVGPALFALVESTLGSYRQALWISATVPLAGLVLAVTSSRDPDDRGHDDAAPAPTSPVTR
jgi:predicted MFS family arabinose efflux permease